MRRLLTCDVLHIAQALSVQAPLLQPTLFELWLDQTQAAAKYKRRFGRPHPQWGDGSLTARALKACPPEGKIYPAKSDFLSTLALVAARLSQIGQSRPLGLS